METLRFLLAVYLLGNSVCQAQPAALTSLTLLTTPLPVSFGVNEDISGLELRLYLPVNDTRTVRVTPTSSGVTFTPGSVVFNSTVSVATGLVARANTYGSLTIDYVVADDNITGSGVVLASQSVTVLPVPTAYRVNSTNWSGVILKNDSFDAVNSSTPTSSFWSGQNHGFSSSSCGSFDGNAALLFTSLGYRQALTAPLGMEGFHGKMHFYHRYGSNKAQTYSSKGDNRISCESPEIGEEVVFGYLSNGSDPRNVSTWSPVLEIPLSTNTTSGNFTSYSIILPAVAMRQTAQFYWMQKTHSSFPIDVATGLTKADVIAAENDPTALWGQMGVQERELWNYRNMFDQWAIDNVRLEVRLNVPKFSLVNNTMLNNATGVGVGETDVLVASPVPGSWVKFTSGDGTQSFPTCETSPPANASRTAVVSLFKSGYIHAVACLSVNGSLISSYPVRSPRFLVQAHKPSLSSTVNSTGSVDTWTISLLCSDCSYMRYTIVPLVGDTTGSFYVPSCTFGSLINSTSASVVVTFNANVRVVACGTDMLQSDLTESIANMVHPRSPTFTYQVPTTTISGFIDVRIVPPPTSINQPLGIVYTIASRDAATPTCNSTLTSGNITLTVKVFDVIRAVACCVGVVCADSALSTWGPVSVKAVTPTYSTACSAIKPLTLVVNLTAATIGSTIRYQVQSTGAALPTLTCSTGSLYTFPFEVSSGSTSLTAVSCLDGLQASDPVVIPVLLDKCCSGRTAYQYPFCSQVLLLNDTFTQCPGNGGTGSVPTNTNWGAITSQWGGSDVNGGVHADNVQCVADTSLRKNVLQLTANGDFFSGVTPVGKTMISDGTLRDRTNADQFLEWALDGVSPVPCSPPLRCPARRVGAAVTTVLQQNAGVMVMRIKPCAAFGTLTQVWWGSYESPVVAAEEATEIPFLPLWKSALYQARTTPNIPFILTSPQSRNATTYNEVVMHWNASAARTNLYFDGQLVMKQMGSQTVGSQSTANSSLSIGVWFPNAVAGQPLFPSCQVLVDQVQVFDLQIAGGRWCDYENVASNTISCTANSECRDWVRDHCFMDIYEAVCTYQRTFDIDDENTTASSNSTAKFCQFRLQPTSQTDVSSTAMTARGLAMTWSEDENVNSLTSQ